MITRHNRDEKSERDRLQRQQCKIQPAKRLSQLLEVIAGRQGHVLQKRPQIAASQRADDQIHRQREDADGHADDARHDEVMNRINA